MNQNQSSCDMEQNNTFIIILDFKSFNPKQMPLESACIISAKGFDEGKSAMTKLGNGILLAVQPKNCITAWDSVSCPQNLQQEELKGYMKMGCILRRNSDPDSNFFTVTLTKGGTMLVDNNGDRSIRLQMPDGLIYRVCTGYSELLVSSNVQAQVAPIQVLLELGENPLDFQISAIYAKYGETPWQQCGIDCRPGAHVDSYSCRIFCGDDCLGVVEAYSNYFSEESKLEFFDVDSYGPSQWYVCNKGKVPVSLIWPNGKTAKVPADKQVYHLEALAELKEENG